jgi:signal transduction histidine kinase
MKKVFSDRYVLITCGLAMFATLILITEHMLNMGRLVYIGTIVFGFFVYVGIIIFYRWMILKKEVELEEQNTKLAVQNEEQDELLRYYSRFAAMEEMISIIAVQWKQPLTTLSLYIQDMEDGYLHGETDSAHIRDIVQKSMRQVGYLANTIDDFRAFFRMDKAKSVFNIVDSVHELTNLVSAVAKINKIKITTDVQNGHVKGYSNEFKQILLNLVNNSIEAIADKSNRGNNDFVHIYNSVENGTMRVFVEDSGGGIPKNLINRLFDPHYTTKSEKDGSGLGLYMTKMIIEKHMNGTINIENIKGGAKVTITLELHNPLPINHE